MLRCNLGGSGVTLPLSMALLSELIGLIYDAAIDPVLWPGALEEMRDALGFGNAILSLHELPTGRILLDVASNVPQYYAEQVGAYGAEVVDLWGGAAALAALPLDEPAVLSRVNPPAVQFDTSTNRYTLEWARPQGLADVLAITLARDGRGIGGLAFGRHDSQGPIGDTEVEAARLLIPHVQRAATINRLLDMTTLAKSTFAAALDSLAVPIVLTNGELHIVHSNPAAQELLDANELLGNRNGVLIARSDAVSNALAVAVKQAAEDESAIGRKGLGIPLRRDNELAGVLHVLPLKAHRHSQGNEPMAAIFVAQTNTPFIAPSGLASALFGFTPAEKRVFEKIVAGNTVAETSEALAIERSTVRTHLLRLFEKTGVSRQSGLMKLAMSLSVPV